MNQEKIIVIDFGGQYNQLVARRVRECHVYCEIYSYRTPIEQIKAMNPKGIILTGGPNSVYEEGAATCSKELFEMGVPVLGLCYGAQLMSHVLGGHVCKAPVREYGKIEVTVDKTSKLFGDVSEKTICWMSHNDYIEKEAPGFRIVAHTPDCPVAAAECEEKKLYAIQFHPSKRSARKLEMEKFSARYPVELTLLLQPLCSQRQSATSSPVYSLITVFSVRMKATR